MKKNRLTLKEYFKKGVIPTESNFADLIDSMLNQDEDNINKLPNDPLRVTATGADEALLNFYRVEKNQEKLSWQIKQKPGGKSGLSIGDDTANRLFIENGTGNVGIGTTGPVQALDVRGRINVENGVIQRGSATPITTISDLGLYSQIDKNWIRIVTTNAPIRFFTDGGIGSKMSLSVEPGKVELIGQGAINDGNGFAVKNNYMASGSLTIGSINQSYGGGSNWTTSTAGLLLETQTNTEIAVHDSGHRLASLMYYEGDSNNRLTVGRDMGWGMIGSIILNGNVGLGAGASVPRSRLDTGNGVLTGAANDYTKAQFTMTGGGTVSWGGASQRLKWTNRFIAISMERSVSFLNGHVNIAQPKSDIPATQVYDGVARSATPDGVVLGGWEALYAVHTVGGDENAISYQIVRYTNNICAPSNWLLVAVVNGDDNSIRLGTGVILSSNSSSSQGSPIPQGVIMMWAGQINNIPSGWALCDGNNNTPNLKDRFIVGAGASYGVGSMGGADTVTLSVGQMPYHNHNAGDFKVLLQRDPAGRWTSRDTDTSVGEPDLIHNTDIQAAGGNQAHENRPPYYALAYIMKL